MENKVCDGCKVVKELEELNDTLVIRKDLLEVWRDQLEKRSEALEVREKLLDSCRDILMERSEAVEKHARMNRRVMLFNIVTSVILLGLCLVKLFG